MTVDFLLEAFERRSDGVAMVWRDRAHTYAGLAAEIRRWSAELDLPAGAVVGLVADYSPRSLALLLALLRRGCVVAPVCEGFGRQKDALFEVAEVGAQVAVDADDAVEVTRLDRAVTQPLLRELVGRGTGGLILFSSGTSGRPKAVVHDGARLLAKYRTPRRAAVTIPFMLFDHIGGINTVLHTLSSGGTAVIAPDRSPETICGLIERHRVEVLPTTPTFVNLLLLSQPERFDLGALKVLGYGAERMPEGTLRRLAEALPGVRLVQNYGMSEVGILRTQSEASDSLWVKLGGDGVQTRVRDGMLEIRAHSAMLGYLGEESPFTEDGWLRTGDRVQTRGDWVRILGRDSDLVMVGGEKVYPAEVEDAISTMPGVLDVVVRGEENALTGHIVAARVQLSTGESRAEFRARMSASLAERLPAFKIPQKVKVTDQPLEHRRLKKQRHG